ncbi:MAG: NAD(P)/FAD-dependent oxidoreductase [Candidatus Hodarchaeota archaeon]
MKVGIIGGNVGGFSAAILLREKDIEVTVYEHKLTWDKPCGGILSSEYVKWLEKHEVILEDKYGTPNYVFLINNRRYEEKAGKIIQFALSREELQRKLWKRADEVGVKINKRKISLGADIESLCEEMDLIVVATGFNRLAATLLGRIYKTEEKAVCRIAEIPTDIQYDEVLFEINTQTTGYGWVFPKRNRVNVGWGRQLGEGLTLREGFNRFIKLVNKKTSLDLEVPQEKIRGGKLPSDVNTLDKVFLSVHHNTPFVGIGDSIGLANPINGGGMCNTFKSAIFLADAVTPPRFYGKQYVHAIKSELEEEWKYARKTRRRFKLATGNVITQQMSKLILKVMGGVIVSKMFSTYK